MKIGVFDSGLGGLVIAKALIEALPQYDYVYFGDTKHLPYGEKTAGHILKYTLNAIRFLIEQDCKLIIIACNSATAVTLRYLQKRFCPKYAPDIKILGVIIPTVEEALTFNTEQIGVVATPTTVRSDIYAVELKKIKDDLDVFSLATPTLVPAIEKGDFDLAEQEVKTYCEKLKNLPVLILGCTHYPIIKDLFQKYLPDTRIIAQTELMGKKLGDYLIRHTEIESKLSQNQTRQFFITKKTEGYLNVARLIDSDIDLKLF